MHTCAHRHGYPFHSFLFFPPVSLVTTRRADSPHKSDAITLVEPISWAFWLHSSNEHSKLCCQALAGPCCYCKYYISFNEVWIDMCFGIYFTRESLSDWMAWSTFILKPKSAEDCLEGETQTMLYKQQTPWDCDRKWQNNDCWASEGIVMVLMIWKILLIQCYATVTIQQF